MQKHIIYDVTSKSCNDSRAEETWKNVQVNMPQPSLQSPCNRKVPLFNDPALIRKMCEFHNSLLRLDSLSCSVCIEHLLTWMSYLSSQALLEYRIISYILNSSKEVVYTGMLVIDKSWEYQWWWRHWWVGLEKHVGEWWAGWWWIRWWAGDSLATPINYIVVIIVIIVLY